MLLGKEIIIEDIKKYFNNTDQYKNSITIKCNDNCDNDDHFFTLNMNIDNNLYWDINEVKATIKDEIKLHIVDIEKDYDCVFSNIESIKIIFHSDLKDINAVLRKINHICYHINGCKIKRILRKNNDKSKKFVLRGERNARYHEKILSNKKKFQFSLRI